jgi:hypothetical protein
MSILSAQGEGISDELDREIKEYLRQVFMGFD